MRPVMANDPLEKLLQIGERDRLCRELFGSSHVFSPAQAQGLGAHARTLGEVRGQLRLAFVHTYTSDLLNPWLDLNAALQGFELDIYHAPYGLALQEARPDSALVQHRPDITVLLLRREDLHPDLGRPLAGLDARSQTRVKQEAAARLRDIVGMLRAQPVGHIVLTFLPSVSGPALGLYDAQHELSEAGWWTTLKSDLAGWLREHVPSSLFLDLDEVMAQVGRSSFFDRRFWYSASFPFAPAAARELARRLISVGVVLKAPKAKVIVLDADNTLWGGVVGEEGLDGIALGPEYPGRAYLEFQRRLLDFQQRGFLLAMCSKNNAADVQEVLDKHPHQLLRDEHFAARRVNWTPKPDNLVSLAKELNLGLESFIFVDDSDHECASVRHQLPQVEVVQVPARPTDIPVCLDHLARLEVLSLTSEDLAKTRMYEEERRRRTLVESMMSEGGSAADYLARLDMRMTVHLDAVSHVARLSQLSGKTNQFNLTTRRYSEAQVREFMADDAWLVADFSLADSFGDSGIVGLAIVRIHSGEEAELDTFLMSCRVIGRQAESAFLHTVLRQLAGKGIRRVAADYLPTAKNELVKNFLPEHGFLLGADGRYRLDIGAQAPRAEKDFPIAVTLAA
jgi:FkbH-like protein